MYVTPIRVSQAGGAQTRSSSSPSWGVTGPPAFGPSCCHRHPGRRSHGSGNPGGRGTRRCSFLPIIAPRGLQPPGRVEAGLETIPIRLSPRQSVERPPRRCRARDRPPGGVLRRGDAAGLPHHSPRPNPSPAGRRRAARLVGPRPAATGTPPAALAAGTGIPPIRSFRPADRPVSSPCCGWRILP